MAEAVGKILRDDVIEQSEIGTIFAFIDDYGKARTAKILSKNSENKTIYAETEFNKNFIVPYNHVLWCQKPGNKRWPKGVYNLLKGKTNGNG